MVIKLQSTTQAQPSSVQNLEDPSSRLASMFDNGAGSPSARVDPCVAAPPSPAASVRGRQNLSLAGIWAETPAALGAHFVAAMLPRVKFKSHR